MSALGSSSPNYLLATEPSLETRQLSFLVGGCGEQRKGCGKERELGDGKPTNCGSLSGSCEAGSFRAASIFSRCIFFEVPHTRYPRAFLSALALASPPARGRSRGLVAVTVLLDKLCRNLHKPQCSRCRGRLEETCFSVGFSLTSAANHSQNRKLEKFMWETLF